MRRTARSRSPLPFLLSLALCLLPALSFQFYLQSGERRCFTEEASPASKVLGEYTVSTGKGTMPVDIIVRMPGHPHSLYERRNADHGKFAFVVPAKEGEDPHVKKAEMHRKVADSLHKTVHDRARRHAEGLKARAAADAAFQHARRGRKLLSIHDHPDDHDHEHGHDHDHHDHDHHDHDHNHDHDHDDHDDEYDYEDDLDDFDEADYDGIDDDDLENDVAHVEHEEDALYGKVDDISVEDREARLFDVKKFEICVESKGGNTGHQRRVRLVIHKGDTAHDYTRLAKKEHLSQLEVSLRQVSGELHALMDELDRARSMENTLRELNENTNKRVVVLAVFSLCSLFAVGGYQAVYTKRFFKQKKIL